MATVDVGAVPEAMRKDVRRAVEILREGGCTEVYVFGSAATGEVRDDSDIDLAVRGCPERFFFGLLGRLLRELEHSVDLVDLDCEDPFSRFLEKEEELVRVG